ncbi:MAG: head GIN domain-containing protein [Bacteroidota bacterium]|nr:head GIN domain-containing protein [Bacteroidota bacterium]MDP4216015.1 head GIN domain-containing protein [Bacteroidota bacterium]MDP4244655.1 head GIN domain-containing protein [Bacteroidota bacterium]MDP4254639.1 head GIN domain-containing protein [Bacteroidota bacterium]MDP4256912.1 head GIN domain-containing protein [Bacteroidota bacterium]
MKWSTLPVAAGLLILNLSALDLSGQQTIIHDPNAELRSITGFHAIDVSDAIDLYLSQGEKETVVVSASDAKWRNRIHTEVREGILNISLALPHKRALEGANHKLKVYISFTALDKLVASGESDVYVDGVISGKTLSISLSGSSDFKGAVHIDELRLDQSGASDAVITGNVTGMTSINAGGASNLRAYDLATGSCDARASGASEIRITINKELTAHASGASRVYYHGPAIIREMHSSGASSISKKG